MQAPASVAWPANPVLALPASAHGWRLPSPGHQLPAGQPAVVHWHVDVKGSNSSAEQQASVVLWEQPAGLRRPAGQFAQVLHWKYEEQPGQVARPVSYWSAPHPVCPRKVQPPLP